jgi:carboxymethylenebutenolidase
MAMTDKTPETAKRPKATAADFHPEVLRLFDGYVHGRIDRRGFLEGAAKFAVGGVSAAALLEALSPDFANAEQVPRTDPRIVATTNEFPSPQGYGTGRGYLVRPASAPPPGGAATPTKGLPAVLVIHENRGLNPHIEDIARRLAIDNFIAFAPDALFPLGGYPGDEDKAREMFGRLDQAKTREDLLAAARYLKGVPGGNGKIGAVGFCWGGSMTNLLATRMAELGAAVPFYGAAPPLENVAAIQAPLLLVFADNDDNVNRTWPGYESALKAAGKRYEAHRYPGTQHGFNNDTTPRFDAGAAGQAWQRTVAFFNRTLRS